METATENIYYPPRPQEAQEGGTPRKSSFSGKVINLLIFVLLWYVVFGWELLSIGLLVVVLFIHEMGHYAAMRAFHYRNVRIFFVPLMGAATTGTKTDVSPAKEAITILAGPVPGIVLGMVLFGVGFYTHNALWLRISWMFLILNVLNLVPIAPFDGGQLMQTLFFRNATLRKVFGVVSMVLATALFIYLRNYILLFIPLSMFLQMRNDTVNAAIRKNLLAQGIDLNKSFSQLTDEEYWRIRDEIGRSKSAYNSMMRVGEYVPSPNEASIMGVVKSLLLTTNGESISKGATAVFVVVWIAAIVLPLAILAWAGVL